MTALKDIGYAPAEKGEEFYQAECDECDDWEVSTSLRKVKAWARHHVHEVNHLDEAEMVTVSILKRLGWVS